MWMEASTVTCVLEKNLCFIGEKYLYSGYLSWTDPTVAHYARDTDHFLEEAGLAALKRDETPPKVSLLRPIRDFWGVLKQDVWRGGWVASSEAKLKRILAIALKKIAPEAPLTMMRGVGLRVRSANRNGTDTHGSPNYMMYSMSQCISFESLVNICENIREIYKCKICLIN